MNADLLVVVALMAGTMITRFVPFLLFPPNRPTPQYIVYLGEKLPYATIGLLVVYCLKEVSVTAAPFAVPELLAILFILVLHWWKRNSLLSIGGGTICYMLLVQLVF